MESKRNLRTGERRTVTVLFSDMTGFTALSEKMDPEEVDSLMTSVFSGFESLVRKYDGSVEKYIGDALVAVFGAPRIHEDDPSRAINAALDFLEAVRSLNRSFRARGIEILFRTGIHTGLITTGKRGDYDVVTGHTMSVASRLEESASPGSILVSDEIRQKCESDYLFSEPVAVPIKGTNEIVQAYTVIGRNTDPLRCSTPFAGREHLLERLLKAYVKADVTEACGFFLIGEPGVGKTRLVAQLVERLRGFPNNNAPVLYARARKYRNLQFAIVNDLLFSYLHVDEYSGHRAVVSAVMRLGVDAEIAEKFASLVSEGEETTTESSSFSLHYAILERILKRYADSTFSVMLVVDNFDDLDDESREFLNFFTRNVTIHPFIVLIGRSEDNELFRLYSSFEVVHLKPFRREEAAELIDRLWPEGEAAVKARILASTEGNPLFIEEYVKFAQRSRDITTPPLSVQNIFLSALERYDAEKQELLKKLSVFLHSFALSDAQYIQQRTGGRQDNLQEVLLSFINDEILIKDNNLYFFKHDLFKQALYNSLLNYNKKILHRLVANLLLKQKSPNTLRLLHHLERSEDYQELERVLFTDPSYLQQTEYLRFLDLLQERVGKRDTNALFRYLFTKAAILFNNGKTEGAEAIVQEIMRLAVSCKKHEFSARAYHLLCAYNMKSYDFEKTEFCGEKAIAYYRKLDPEPSAIQDVYSIMATANLLHGDFDGNQRIIERMQSVSDPHYDLRTIVMAERAFHLGDYRGAIELILSSIPAERSPSNERWITGVVRLVRIYRQMFDFERLRDRAQEVIGVFSQDFATLTDLYSYLAESSHVLGERDQTPAYLKQAEYYASQSQIDFDLIHSLRNLSIAFSTVGETEKAERSARHGLEIALRHSIYFPMFSLLVLLAEIYSQRGAHDDARYILEEADFVVERRPYLANQDLALYHYFKSRYTDGDARRRHVESAARLLAEEERRIGDGPLVERLHSLRSFGRVRAELGTPAK